MANQPYRETPSVAERVRRVGWAWPLATAIGCASLGFAIARIAGCVREDHARTANECHDTVLSNGWSDSECPHKDQRLQGLGNGLWCTCPRPQASASASASEAR